MSKSYHAKILIFVLSVILMIFFVQIYAKKAYDRLSSPEPSTQLEEVSKTLPFSDSEEENGEIKVSGGLTEQQKILSFDMSGYTKDGKKKWDIRGQSADIVSDVIILNDLHATAYSEDRTVNLTADSGKYDKKKNSVRLENNVVIKTSDGVNLSADWFLWESETDMIATESYVEVSKDNLYAAGYGATASVKSKEVQLNRDIVVKQDDVEIKCGGPLTIDYENDKASFYKNVQVTDPRGILFADRLDVFFDRESRQIDEVVAERNVEVRHGENIAKGQKIIYTLASGEVTLTGNPEIIIYSKEDVKDALAGN
ncbi:MAG: LPS export ABC transporter periplasmic protein LptC [Candidatus Omnitrophica bacterium]|nr:LPS export ABC transporter periplasmic protein LptC [Candidatus Omnitrophota bacterium]